MSLQEEYNQQTDKLNTSTLWGTKNKSGQPH